VRDSGGDVERKTEAEVEVCQSHQGMVREAECLTLHRRMRKRFASNPYKVTNMMDVWEIDRLDVRAHAKSKNKYIYIYFRLNMYSRN